MRIKIETSALAFHIDVDEANAGLNFNREQKVEYGSLIIKSK